MSASTVVLETDAGEALALLVLLAALARANDDVILLADDEDGDAWPREALVTAAAITRLRLRTSRPDRVFDAIGEHTRALVIASPDTELLEALCELGPTVIALGATSVARPGVTLRADGAVLRVTLVGLAPELCASIERSLATLTGRGQRLAP